MQWALAAGPAVKLAVREEGWYRVGQPELVAAGLDPQVDPRTLQLFVAGKEQAIRVTGEQDGRFDPGDVIEFYGIGLSTPWTDTRVYWLVWGTHRGTRIQTVEGRGGLPGTAASFPVTVERKDRTIYFAALLNGDAENFFGPVIATEPVAQRLTLQHLDPAPPGEARLEVALQGVTAGPHHVRLALNGGELAALDFTGQDQGVLQVPISQARLQEGDNLVTILPQGSETDVSLVDAVRLTYWHTYTADGDVVRAPVRAGRAVTLAGFSASPLRVLDITDPLAVQELSGTVVPQGAGVAVTVTPPGSGKRTLLALTEGQVKRPAALVANQPSAWHQAAPGADLVIIAHEFLLGSLGPLKALREAQGWAVAVIDMEDLYDEFAFGAKGPWALRDFLAHASAQWPRPPRFVLLVGAASFDPRNYLGLGAVDLVPTKLVDTALLETASDDWFADLDDEGLPKLAVGRWPVRTAAEAATVVQKLLSYEQASAAEGWTSQVLLVADRNDIFDFEAASAQVAAVIPPTRTIEGIFLGQTDVGTARSALLTSLTQGQVLVNYIGHGSVDLWRGELLTAADAHTLTNAPRLPVVVIMDCLNGLFHDPRIESLAAALLSAEQGGAVAVWASSGLTAPEGQAVMDEALVRLLFQGLTLGEAVVQAKGTVADGDVRRTWILFGDPTTRLK